MSVNLLGANFEAALAPGQELLIYGNDTTPDVASGAKTLDLSGTGTDELEVAIILG